MSFPIATGAKRVQYTQIKHQFTHKSKQQRSKAVASLKKYFLRTNKARERERESERGRQRGVGVHSLKSLQPHKVAVV